MMTNYEQFRGKCKEMSEALVASDPSLRIARGHYECPIWGDQEHWWCVDQSGAVVDPTKLQFPSGGIGRYREHDGMFSCEYCGKEVEEKDVTSIVHHTYCSGHCAYRDVM